MLVKHYKYFNFRGENRVQFKLIVGVTRGKDR